MRLTFSRDNKLGHTWRHFFEPEERWDLLLDAETREDFLQWRASLPKYRRGRLGRLNENEAIAALEAGAVPYASMVEDEHVTSMRAGCFVAFECNEGTRVAGLGPLGVFTAVHIDEGAHFCTGYRPQPKGARPSTRRAGYVERGMRKLKRDAEEIERGAAGERGRRVVSVKLDRDVYPLDDGEPVQVESLTASDLEELRSYVSDYRAGFDIPERFERILDALTGSDTERAEDIERLVENEQRLLA